MPTASSSNDAARSLAEIGLALRAHRQRRNLTLVQVATRADLSESALSRIERGQIGISVIKLAQICEALSIGIDELFNADNRHRRTGVVTHESLSGSDAAAGTGYFWKHLAGGALLDDLDVYHLIMPSGETMHTFVSHQGQEYCFVLRGVIDFLVGRDRYRLQTGEGIFLDSELPHRAERVGQESAEMLMIVAGRTRQANANLFDRAGGMPDPTLG